jgi:4-hydroxymandelate synthase
MTDHAIHAVDHVEWYVADARQAARVWCAGYGFHIRGHGGPETGLPGQRSVLLAQGGIRILLTSGLHRDHPASEFVARHGDGVAVTAFGTGDAAAEYARLVAAGGTGLQEPRTWTDGTTTVVTAEVSGFGDVVHRLVERSGPEFLPTAIAADRRQGADDQPGPPDLLHDIDHAAVCVPAGDLAPTVAFYQNVFGFSVIFEERIEVGGQGMLSKVVQSPSGGVTFTILEPDTPGGTGQIADFLAWHGGAGVQHLAFGTDDIVRAVRTCAERGVEFATTPGDYYDMLDERLDAADVPVDTLRPLGVLVDRDHWGLMYQIFAKSTHIRRTYFTELISRHGARTFGTRNIPALYAAKARELATLSDQEGTNGDPVHPDSRGALTPAVG